MSILHGTLFRAAGCCFTLAENKVFPYIYLYIYMQKVGNQSNKSFEKSNPASYPAQELVQSEILLNIIFTTPGVMSCLFSPFWDHKRSCVQTHWCACETPASPLPMSLTWVLSIACQVGSAVVFFFGLHKFFMHLLL
jgi:hypothetical protein